MPPATTRATTPHPIPTAQSMIAFALNSSSRSQPTHYASGIFIYVLHQARQRLLDAKVLKSSPYDTSGYTIQYLFHIDEAMYTVLFLFLFFVGFLFCFLRHGTFCSWCKMGMVSVLPGLGMKQNCMSPILVVI